MSIYDYTVRPEAARGDPENLVFLSYVNKKAVPKDGLLARIITFVSLKNPSYGIIN